MTALDDPSGHALAEAAYEAGAVEPVETIPSHTVSLRFTMLGEHTMVHAYVEGLILELLARSDVQSGEYSVTANE